MGNIQTKKDGNLNAGSDLSIERPVTPENINENSFLSNVGQTPNGSYTFEVYLSPNKQPMSPRSTMVQTSVAEKITPSRETIDEKLKAAETRRLKLESAKIEKMKLEKRLSDAAVRREQKETEFRSVAEQQHTTKLEVTAENREKIIQEIKEKAEQREKHVEAVRMKHEEELKQKSEQVTREIDHKLTLADDLRQQHIDLLREKLREHDAHVEEVRARLNNFQGNDKDFLEESDIRRKNLLDAINEKADKKENISPMDIDQPNNE